MAHEANISDLLYRIDWDLIEQMQPILALRSIILYTSFFIGVLIGVYVVRRLKWGEQTLNDDDQKILCILTGLVIGVCVAAIIAIYSNFYLQYHYPDYYAVLEVLRELNQLERVSRFIP